MTMALGKLTAIAPSLDTIENVVFRFSLHTSDDQACEITVEILFQLRCLCRLSSFRRSHHAYTTISLYSATWHFSVYTLNGCSCVAICGKLS